MSKIPWTEKTWNPVVGCTKCSPGCTNCYAERRAYRLACMALADIRKGRNPGLKKYYLEVVHMDGPNKGKWNGRVVCIPEALEIPLHWRKPRKIFVCSMSDLFHPKVSFGFILDVVLIAQRTPRHTYQFLTKRISRALEFAEILSKEPTAKWPSNIHLGVSISTPDELYKAEILKQIPAAVKYLSLEPLLADMGRLNLKGFDQVIIGAESKGSWPGRHCDNKWVKNIVDQCVAAGVAVFVKQLHSPTEYHRTMVYDGLGPGDYHYENGEVRKCKLLKYPKDIKKFPPGLRRQEYPK